MGKPFKGLRVLGHPVHAPLTHFPLALWSSAFLGDLIFLWQGDTFWWRFSFWTIAIGLGLGTLTLATGFLDYVFIPSEEAAAEKTAALHMTVMLAVACLFAASLYFHRGQAPAAAGQQMTGLILSGVGTLFLQLGGWLGGKLVYHHGIGLDKS